MKIWTVWFSDCFSTSHALFFFSSKFFFSIVVQQTTFQLPNLGLWTDTYTRINSPLNQPKHIRINNPKINISGGLFKGVKREKRARAHAAESFATVAHLHLSLLSSNYYWKNRTRKFRECRDSLHEFLVVYLSFCLFRNQVDTYILMIYANLIVQLFEFICH